MNKQRNTRQTNTRHILDYLSASVAPCPEHGAATTQHDSDQNQSEKETRGRPSLVIPRIHSAYLIWSFVWPQPKIKLNWRVISASGGVNEIDKRSPLILFTPHFIARSSISRTTRVSCGWRIYAERSSNDIIEFSTSFHWSRELSFRHENPNPNTHACSLPSISRVQCVCSAHQYQLDHDGRSYYMHPNELIHK